VKWLNVVGLGFGCIAAVLLFGASRAMPWTERTLGGETGPELEFTRRRGIEARWGFGLLAASFVLQLVGALAR
jgi:hypothetical protein